MHTVSFSKERSCSVAPTSQPGSSAVTCSYLTLRPALTCVYGESLALLLGRDARLLAVLQLSVRLLVQGNEALDVGWSRESWRPLYSVSLKTHKQKSSEVQCIDVESFSCKDDLLKKTMSCIFSGCKKSITSVEQLE